LGKKVCRLAGPVRVGSPITDDLLGQLREIIADDQRCGTEMVRCKCRPRALVVEDNPLDANVLISLLEDRTSEVVWSLTAEDAWDQICNNQPIDIVFLDLSLGHGMNGVELLRRIVDQPARQPTIVVSGYVPPEMARVGYVGVVVKPIQKKDVDDIFRVHRFSA
jgi:CheY-like chemotaxis protein